MKEAKNGVEHVPTEDAEQIAFFDWVRLAYPKLIAYHVPNGFGRLGRIGRLKSRRKGVTSGIPDISIDKPRGIYHGMRIEMKRLKGGKLSDEQKEMIASLRAEGYFVAVCKGFESAREALIEYLGLGEPTIYG
jgi:hypothetical protein